MLLKVLNSRLEVSDSRLQEIDSLGERCQLGSDHGFHIIDFLGKIVDRGLYLGEARACSTGCVDASGVATSSVHWPQRL